MSKLILSMLLFLATSAQAEDLMESFVRGCVKNKQLPEKQMEIYCRCIGEELKKRELFETDRKKVNVAQTEKSKESALNFLKSPAGNTVIKSCTEKAIK